MTSFSVGQALPTELSLERTYILTSGRKYFIFGYSVEIYIFFVNFFFMTLTVLALFSVLFFFFLKIEMALCLHVDAFRMELYFTEAFLAGSHDSVMFKRLL